MLIRKKIIVVDSEGKAIPVKRSMYKEPVELSKRVSINEYYNFVVERTYFLVSEEQEALDRILEPILEISNKKVINLKIKL